MNDTFIGGKKNAFLLKTNILEGLRKCNSVLTKNWYWNVKLNCAIVKAQLVAQLCN